MTTEAMWTAGKRNELLTSINEKLGELVQATKERQTIVPLFMFVRSDMRSDEMAALSDHLTAALVNAGFSVPTAREIEPAPQGVGGEGEPDESSGEPPSD